MYMTESAIRTAILTTLRDLGTASGDRIPLPVIKYRWFKTGLRESDLIDGLVALCVAGTLTYEDEFYGFICRPSYTSPRPQDGNLRDRLMSVPRAMEDMVLQNVAKLRPRSGPALYNRRKTSSKN